MSIAVAVAELWDVAKCPSSDRRQVLEDAMLDSWLSEAVGGKSSGRALSLLSMHARSISSGATSSSLAARDRGFGSCGQWISRVK